MDPDMNSTINSLATANPLNAVPSNLNTDASSPSSDSQSLRKFSADSSMALDANGSPENQTSPDSSTLENASHESSASYQSGAGKRKSDLEGEDFIRRNPELYGLRRSGRARTVHDLRETESENESASDIDAAPPRKRRRHQIQKSTKAVSPRDERASSTSSESDSSSYGQKLSRAHRRRNQKRRQMSKVASSRSVTPVMDAVRFSSRRTGRVTTYNEDNDDDDEFLEDNADLLVDTPGQFEEVVDETPMIGAVLDHKFTAAVDAQNPPTLPSKDQLEYLVKWENKAYIHATWQPWASLVKLRGAKKLRNYHKFLHARLLEKADPDRSREDEEQNNLAKEREMQALQDYTRVERVIGTRLGEDGTEYYVKWKALPYDHCTWEKDVTVSELSQPQIDRFLARSSRSLRSNKYESNPATRSRYERFTEQPEYVKNGELRAFQIKGVNFLAHNWCRGHNVILADEMGLGKTVQTVSFMSWLVHARQQEGPFLVVVPLSTIPSWAETLDHWTPDLNYVVYNGNTTARQIIQEYELFPDGDITRPKFNILLTTYEYVLQDSSFLSKIKWQFLAVDEAHRLKNPKSVLYGALIDLAAPSRLLITGTPIQNNLGELSALMNFLMPGQGLVNEDIDLQSEAAIQQIAELTQQISPYILRRTKQKVENDLPPKTEKIIRVELSDVQLEYYKNILTKNYAALNEGGDGHKQSLLNIMMELKKASNHPFMFPNAESRILAGKDRPDEVLKALITSSGKMMLLDQLLLKLKKDNHRVLIFSQMVRMLDIIGDYMKSRGHQFQRLDGTIPAASRKSAIDQFNAPDSKDFAFLLSTRAGGLGINLMTADTVVLFDSDWNPQADLQAMARAHRIGQKYPVTVYRFVAKDTVEEEILQRARNKLMLEWITIQRGVTDTDSKDPNDQRLMKAKEANSALDNADAINRILKQRGQKMFEQTDNQKKLEQLDIDAVLADAEEHHTEQPEGLAADGGEEFLKSFEYHDVKVDLEWDDIIPKEELEAIKAKEQKAREEAFLKAAIEQEAPRKRKPPQSDEPEQRTAKKRARLLNKQHASESEDEYEINDDPKRPLDVSELRHLVKAHEKYGSIENRCDDVIKEARLTGRDIDMLKSILNEVEDVAKRFVEEEKERLETLEKTEGRAITKKDRRTLLFEYKGVGQLNAQTIVERPVEMRLLRDAIASVPDVKSFRIPEASKLPSWTVEWGHREDGMLAVGVFRHGYGAWSAIRDDPDLELGDKFFLEENQVAQKVERLEKSDKSVRTPGATHLVRRIAYLVSVLKERNVGPNFARKMLHPHRMNRKIKASDTASHSASPAPHIAGKQRRDSDSKIRNSSELQESATSNQRSPSNDHNSESENIETRDIKNYKSSHSNNIKKSKKRATGDTDTSGKVDHNGAKSQASDLSEIRNSPIIRSLDSEQPKISTKRKLSDHEATGNNDRNRSKFQAQSGSERRDNLTAKSPEQIQAKNSKKRKSEDDESFTGINTNGAKRRDTKDATETPSQHALEEIFNPLARACRGLQRSKPAETEGHLLRIAKRIQLRCQGKSPKYEDMCWDYLVRQYWPGRVGDMSRVRREAIRLVEKEIALLEEIRKDQERNEKLRKQAQEQEKLRAEQARKAEQAKKVVKPARPSTNFFQSMFGGSGAIIQAPNIQRVTTQSRLLRNSTSASKPSTPNGQGRANMNGTKSSSQGGHGTTNLNGTKQHLGNSVKDNSNHAKALESQVPTKDNSNRRPKTA